MRQQLLLKKETEGGREEREEGKNVISSRPPTDSGQHSHERRARRRFVRNLRSRIHNYQKTTCCCCCSCCLVNLVLFSFSSNHFSCARKKFREREREKEKVILIEIGQSWYTTWIIPRFSNGEKINSSQLRAGPTPLNWDSRHWK